MKFLGHSNKGDLYNSPCTLDHLMCTYKAFVLERTLPDIQNPALTDRKRLTENERPTNRQGETDRQKKRQTERKTEKERGRGRQK